MSINILFLAAGKVDFDTKENGYPLCLTTTNDDQILLERIANNTKSIDGAEYYYSLLDEHVEKYHLDRVAELITPKCHIIRVPNNTAGSACTALLAASQMNYTSELLIISVNELVDVEFGEIINNFTKRNLDGATLVFKSVHPRYSYVKIGKDGFVTESAQRNPISNNATAGVFWFKNTGDFVNAAERMIMKGASVDSKYYVAPVFNEMILNQEKIGVFELDSSTYKPIKDEKQFRDF